MPQSRFRFLPSFAAGLLLLAGCSKQARRDRVVAHADQDYAAGSYKEAEIEYRQALVLVREDPVAVRQLALIYFAQGRTRTAYVYLKKAYELLPQETALGGKLAETELALNLKDRARQTATAVLAKDPRNADALLALAQSCRTPKDVEATRAQIEKWRSQGDAPGFGVALGLLDLTSNVGAAEKDFRAALALDPKSADAHGGLSNTLLRQRNLKGAEAEVGIAADDSPLRSKWRIRQIELEIQTGDVAAAREKLTDLTTKAPDFVSAWEVQMKLDLSQRKFDDCDRDIKQVLSHDPGNPDAVLEKGALSLAKGDPAQAVEDYKDADRTFPKVPLIQYQLGVAYLRKKDPAMAEQRLTAALKLDPTYVPATLVLAELQLSRGNAAGAIDRLSRLLERQPQVQQAYLILGRALESQKNWDGALRTFAQMEKMLPKDPQAPYRAGLVYQQLKRPSDARAAFQRAVTLRPGFAPALEMLVNLDLQAKDIAGAQKRVAALVAQYPKSPAPWLLQAKIDVAGKNTAAAKVDLNKALEIDPTTSNAYVLLTRIYLAEHDTKQAEQELRAMIAKTKSPSAMMQLAAICLSQKKYAEAKTEFEQILAANPKFTPAMVDLAWVDAEDLHNLPEAETYARQAHELAPDDANADRALGWVLVRKGAAREGLGELQAAAEQLSTDADAQYRLGAAYYALGNEDLARSTLHRALALGPDPAVKTAINQRLAFLEMDVSHPTPQVRTRLADRIKEDANDGVAMSRLADVEMGLGDAADAAAHYHAAMALQPPTAHMYMQLAVLNAGPLHNKTEALADAKSAHELAPTDAGIARTLGRLVADAGDSAWSLDLLQQASRALPDDAALSFDLAQAYYRMGRVSEAQDAASNAAATATGEFAAKVARFASLAGITSPEDAASALPKADEALKSDPDYLPARMVQALAAEQQAKPADAAADYDAILHDVPTFFPAARRLAVCDFVLGKYTDTAHLIKDTQRAGKLDAETQYCYAMSLVRIKDTEGARPQLRNALLGNLPEPKKAELRRALRDLR